MSAAPRNPLGRFSFRFLAFLATVGTVAVTTVVLTAVGEQQLKATIEQEAEGALLLDARNLASVGSEVLLSEFPELILVPLIKELQDGRPDLVRAVVLDEAGIIRGGPEPRRIGQEYEPIRDGRPLDNRLPLIRGESLTAGPGWIQVATPIRHHAEGEIGRVIIAVDGDVVSRKLHGARRTALTTAVGLLFAAVAVVTLCMTLLYRPARSLRAGLARISEGVLDQPIRVTGPSEFVRLAEALNHMAEALRESRELAVAREAEAIATQREVIVTLGEVVESRSHETAHHTLRVGAMSAELARLAGRSGHEVELVRMAAPMHDVGKIGIPDEILCKPGRLTEYEESVMRTHTEIGRKILSGSERELLQAAAIIAHQHHERWDGRGYPQGLLREQIHIFGRIVSLIDVFDALHTDRVYRPALPLDDVIAYLREQRGRMFDPALVDLFLDHVERFIEIFESMRDAGPRRVAPEVPAPAPEEAVLV